MTIIDANERLTGKRKSFDGKGSSLFPERWMRTVDERRGQVNEWRYIAMQVITRNGGGFRIMAIIDAVFDMSSCQIISTDEEMAIEAGGCSVKTISRDIRAMKDMGLIIAEETWIEKNGKMVKGRKIRLSIPSDLSGIFIR